MRGTIVCDVTDPAESRSAVEFSRALAARLGLRVVLAYVADGRVAAVESAGERERLGAAEAALRTIVGELGAEVETRIAVGDRAEMIAFVAAEEGADVVIVGSRAAGFGGRNLRSTLVRDLEAATPVPVLVAPPPTRKRGERRLALGCDGETG